MAGNRLWITSIICICIWACISVYPPLSFAGILTIETQTTVQTNDYQLEVTVKITNNGNEPAYNTQINMIVLDEKTQGPIKAKLDPGEADVNTFTKTLFSVTTGRYPLIIRVDFHDANFYPFSALSVLTFFFGKDVICDLAVIGDNITLDKEGVLYFHIKNMGSDSINLSASLFLPKEFLTSASKKTLHIDARSEKNLSFDISNFSARNGSSYPLYCCFEYENNKIHFTSIANILVNVKIDEGWFRGLKWVWVCTIIILIIGVSGIFILRNKTKSTPP